MEADKAIEESSSHAKEEKMQGSKGKKSRIPEWEIQAIQPDSQGFFHCNYCGFRTHFRMNVIRHETTLHHVLRPWLNIINCELCDYVVLQYSEYLRHIRTHVNNPPNLKDVPCMQESEYHAILAEMKLKLHKQRSLKASSPGGKKVHYRKIMRDPSALGKIESTDLPIQDVKNENKKRKKLKAKNKTGKPQLTAEKAAKSMKKSYKKRGPKGCIKPKSETKNNVIKSEPNNGIKSEPGTQFDKVIKSESSAKIDKVKKVQKAKAVMKKKILQKHQKLKQQRRERIFQTENPLFYVKDAKASIIALDGKYNCPYCSFSSSIKTSMQRHLVTLHKAWSSKVYGCQKCNVRTTNRYDFSRHVNSQRHKINNSIPVGVKEDLDSYVEDPLVDRTVEEPLVHSTEEALNASDPIDIVNSSYVHHDDSSNDSTLLNSQNVLYNLDVVSPQFKANKQTEFPEVKLDIKTEKFDMQESNEKDALNLSRFLTDSPADKGEQLVPKSAESQTQSQKLEKSVCSKKRKFSESVSEDKPRSEHAEDKTSNQNSESRDTSDRTDNLIASEENSKNNLVGPLLQRLRQNTPYEKRKSTLKSTPSPKRYKVNGESGAVSDDRATLKTSPALSPSVQNKPHSKTGMSPSLPCLKNLFPHIKFYQPNHTFHEEKPDQISDGTFQIVDVRGGLSNLWPESVKSEDRDDCSQKSVQLCSVAIQVNETAFTNTETESHHRVLFTSQVSKGCSSSSSYTQTSELDWFMVEFETSFSQTIQPVL